MGEVDFSVDLNAIRGQKFCGILVKKNWEKRHHLIRYVELQRQWG
jgi:hypothetical protein